MRNIVRMENGTLTLTVCIRKQEKERYFMSDSTNPVSDAGTTDNAATATEAPVVQATDVTSTIAPSIAMSPKWIEAIQPLVSRLGLTALEVTQAILTAKLVKIPNDDAVDVLTDPDSITNEDFSEAFPTATKGDLRRAVLEMRATGKPAPATAAVAQSPIATSQQAQMAPTPTVLVPLPEGAQGSLLDGLALVQMGKVGLVEVSNGIRVALAAKAGLFKVPDILLSMMDDYVTNRMEEAAPPEYYTLEDEVASRENAEVLKVLKVDGRFVSKARKMEFLDRIEHLWEPARSFNEQLHRWQESYVGTTSTPAALVSLLAGANNPFGATMMPAPDTSPLHDGSQLLIRSINMAFAGRSIPAAMALAFDAERINGFLSKSQVVLYSGCANREELVRALSAKVGSTLVTPEYKRLELSLVQFILNVYRFDEIAPKGSPQELRFIAELFQLGQSIPWEKLLSAKSTSVASSGRVESPFPLGSDSHDSRRRGSRGDGSYRE